MYRTTVPSLTNRTMVRTGLVQTFRVGFRNCKIRSGECLGPYDELTPVKSRGLYPEEGVVDRLVVRQSLRSPDTPVLSVPEQKFIKVTDTERTLDPQCLSRVRDLSSPQTHT